MREIPLPARRRDAQALDWSKSFWARKALDEKELIERVEKGLTVSPI